MTENLAKQYCEKYFDTVSDEFACEISGMKGVALVNDTYGEVYYNESWVSLFNGYVFFEIVEDVNNIGEDDVKDYLGEELYNKFVEMYSDKLPF